MINKKTLIDFIDQYINDYSRHIKISSNEVIESFKKIKSMIEETKEIEEIEEIKTKDTKQPIEKTIEKPIEKTIEELREEYIEKFNKKPFPWWSKEILMDKINK